MRHPLEFSPSARAELAPQSHDVPDSAANRNDFNLPDLTKNLKGHGAILHSAGPGINGWEGTPYILPGRRHAIIASYRVKTRLPEERARCRRVVTATQDLSHAPPVLHGAVVCRDDCADKGHRATTLVDCKCLSS